MTQWGKLLTLNKAMGKLWGAKWPDVENGKLGPWWHNGTLIWGALWWRNGQIRDPSDEIEAPWWPNGEIWPIIPFKGFNKAPLHSFKLVGPKFQLGNFRCHASRKRIHGALNLHCSSYISKIVWWYQCLISVFSVIYLRLMGLYRVGAPVRVFEKFRSLSLFFLFFLSFSYFFSILHFLFSLSLGGPFSSGAPGHCPPMPPSRYATGQLALKPGPRSKTSSYGDRAFAVAAPKLWNNILYNIRSAASIGQFKTQLKTFLFN